MKLGIAAADTPKWPKCDWVEQAARKLGYDTHRSTTWKTLPALLRECDVVLFGHKNVACHYPGVRDAIENRTAKIVYWWFDLVATQLDVPIAEQPLFRTFAPMFRAADVSLVKERGLLSEYRAAGVNAQWCDQGCPDDYPAVSEREPEWDLLVWGQAGCYRQRMRDVQTAVDAGFKVAWACPQSIPLPCERLPWTPAWELPALCSRARCVLSCGVRNDLEGYWSDQFWLACGAGACVLRRETPGLPEGPYRIYRDGGELCQLLSWARNNPEETRETGWRTRQWVMREHTIGNRVDAVLGALCVPDAKGPASSG